MSEAAGLVKLPAFKPKQGVHIETDPKGTAKPIANGDDTAVIEDLISQLEVLLELHGRYLRNDIHVLDVTASKAVLQ